MKCVFFSFLFCLAVQLCFVAPVGPLASGFTFLTICKVRKVPRLTIEIEESIGSLSEAGTQLSSLQDMLVSFQKQDPPIDSCFEVLEA